MQRRGMVIIMFDAIGKFRHKWILYLGLPVFNILVGFGISKALGPSSAFSSVQSAALRFLLYALSLTTLFTQFIAGFAAGRNRPTRFRWGFLPFLLTMGCLLVQWVADLFELGELPVLPMLTGMLTGSQRYLLLSIANKLSPAAATDGVVGFLASLFLLTCLIAGFFIGLYERPDNQQYR